MKAMTIHKCLGLAMHHGALFSLMLGLLPVVGCFTVDMGANEVDLANQYQVSVNSVDEVIPKITFVKNLPNGRRLYELELIAQGDFIKHNGVRREKRVNRLCVGVFPGVASWKYTCRESSGNDNDWWCAAFFGNAICNTLFVGIPTLSSLFIEPFLAYYKDESETSISDLGLIGVRKYIKSDGRRYVEKSSEPLKSFTLAGYKVCIDGAECEDTADANGGCDGKVVFNTSRPRGSRFLIKLLSKPIVHDSSDDNISDLIGIEMETVLP